MTLFSWGANQYGQLGHSSLGLTSEQCETPQPCDITGLPENIKIVEICGGGGHTLLLDSIGRVWSCGHNNKGQCGVKPSAVASSSNNALVPPWTKVDIGCGRIVKIAAGWEHSLALTSDGELLGWGSNNYGQLGPGVAKGDLTWKTVQIASNVSHMSTGLRCSTWVTIDGKLRTCDTLGIQNIDVPEMLRAIKTATGQRHILVLMNMDECTNEYEGQVWGWGQNVFGQIAWDTCAAKTIQLLSPAKLIENLIFSDIKCGWSHSAGLTSTGQIVCWGRNSYGQVGTFPTDEKAHKPLAWPLYQSGKGLDTRAVQIELGSEHTLVRLDNGSVLSCGWNEHGNCGTGNCTDVHNPKLILQNATLIGTGYSHSFAVVNM